MHIVIYRELEGTWAGAIYAGRDEYPIVTVSQCLTADDARLETAKILRAIPQSERDMLNNEDA